MYYPYLRGKQYELILLRSQWLFDGNLIHPIIEPVNKNTRDLIRTIKSLNESNQEYTLIINPQKGDFRFQTIELDKINSSTKNVNLGFILNGNTDINDFQKLTKLYSKYNFTLLHYNNANRIDIETILNINNIKQYIVFDNIPTKEDVKKTQDKGISLVSIKDGFQKERVNADYGEISSFGVLHSTALIMLTYSLYIRVFLKSN